MISPHQDQKLLRELMEALAKEYRVKPYLREIEEGWRKGRELSKKMGLYHQKYCGCIYSEAERYQKIN
jgi:predicted adenine nucleotide alpha hydrolase (AANH) superfamily ATPase